MGRARSSFHAASIGQPADAVIMADIGVNGGDKSGHVAAQNSASGGEASTMARALPRSWRVPWIFGPQGRSCDG